MQCSTYTKRNVNIRNLKTEDLYKSIHNYIYTACRKHYRRSCSSMKRHQMHRMKLAIYNIYRYNFIYIIYIKATLKI